MLGKKQKKNCKRKKKNIFAGIRRQETERQSEENVVAAENVVSPEKLSEPERNLNLIVLLLNLKLMKCLEEVRQSNLDFHIGTLTHSNNDNKNSQ